MKRWEKVEFLNGWIFLSWVSILVWMLRIPLWSLLWLLGKITFSAAPVMQFWKLVWRRNGITTKCQWVESQLLEAEPNFTGLYSSVTETPTRAQGKPPQIHSAGPGQSPVREGSFGAPHTFLLALGPPSPLPCSGAGHAAVETRQTHSPCSSVNRNNGNSIFCLSV